MAFMSSGALCRLIATLILHAEYHYAYIVILVEGLGELLGRLVVVGLGEEPLDGRALLRLEIEERKERLTP